MAVNLNERKLTLTQAKDAGLVTTYDPFRFRKIESSSQKEFQDAYKYKINGKNLGILTNEELLIALGAGSQTELPESFYVNAFNTYMDQIIKGAKYAYDDDGVKTAQEIKRKFFESQRDIGEVKATSRRAARSVGGLLASAASPNLGTGGGASGPMLGEMSELGGSSTLGMRGKL